MLIYKNYDQEALDRQYNNRLNVPGFATYLEQWEWLSRETEKMFPCVKDISYGLHLRERLDIYPARLPNAATVVFIHGGYWQMFDKSSFHFIARAFQPYGVTTVLINYPLAPANTMDNIVFSCRSALDWLHQNLSAFNGNSDAIFVAGHSAGGHLSVMLMQTNWPQFNTRLPANLVKGAVALSGIFNLIPVRLSYVNKVLNIDTEAAIRNSPVHMEEANSSPLILAVGEEESAEFNDQSSEMYSVRIRGGLPARLLQVRGQNHFSILETMLDPGSILSVAIKEMMNI